MSKTYVTIYCSDMGDHKLEMLSRRELESRLDESYYGPNLDIWIPDADTVLRLEEFHGLIIIDGTFVVPGREQRDGQTFLTLPP